MMTPSEARAVLLMEVQRLRAGYGGHGGGSINARTLAEAIEVMLDITVAGKRAK